MEFPVLTPDEVSRAVDAVHESGTQGVRIVLRTGEMLTGTLTVVPFPEAGAVTAHLQERESPTVIGIYPGLVASHQLIRIPIAEVSGVVPLGIATRTLRFDDVHRPSPVATIEALGSVRNLTLEVARKSHLEVIDTPSRSESILSGQVGTAGEGFGFTGDAGLYWDREFFADRKGGFNSFGFNWGPGGFSLGWDKSLWSMFKKKINEFRTPISELCASSEASIFGFPAFLGPSELAKLPEAFREMDAEGGNWFTAALSGRPLEAARIGPSLLTGQAALCFYRKECFLFPRKAWQAFSQPISTYGDVTRFSLETGWGAVPCYMKARAGAYLTDS